MNNYVRWDLGEVTRRRDYRGTEIPESGIRQPRTETTRERRPKEIVTEQDLVDAGFVRTGPLGLPYKVWLIGGAAVIGAFLLLRKKS